jgi:glycerol-3-phosphate acyltransferase PlsY
MPEFDALLVARLAAAFLLGSIPFAVLAMAGTGVDIRKIGSGNPGFNNVLRFSKPRALLCLAGDVGKGAVAILTLHRPGESVEVAWLLALAVMLGHCYSPWLNFRGGKGVATSAGVMLVLYWKLALACVALYVAGRLIGSRRKWVESGAKASLAAAVLFAVLVLAGQGPREGLYAAGLVAIITWRHRDNLRRMLQAASS